MNPKIQLQINESRVRRNPVFIVRISNLSQDKTDVSMKFSYVSTKYGILGMWCDMQPDLRNNEVLLPGSFLDVAVELKKSNETKSGYFSLIKLVETDIEDGDSIIVTIPDYLHATFARKNGLWELKESKSLEINIESFKQKIEHFEELEEKLGISFQNFSIQLKDSHSFSLFFESITIREELCKGMHKIRLRLAIYNTNNDIIRTQGLNIYNPETSVFQIMEFQVRDLEIPIRDISRIRVFPVYEQ